MVDSKELKRLKKKGRELPKVNKNLTEEQLVDVLAKDIRKALKQIPESRKK